jgi:hypothetical protein
MASEKDTPQGENAAEAPDDADLEEPSTEKAPEEEPKRTTPDEPEPSHEAVGIGVIGGPLVDPEQGSDAG